MTTAEDGGGPSWILGTDSAMHVLAKARTMDTVLEALTMSQL